jgi:hypothetical protein
MIPYFITWFEYNDHHEKYIKHVQWGRAETLISNIKGATRILVVTAGCHPRYMLPTPITRYRGI